jgi:hypothetical protein
MGCALTLAILSSPACYTWKRVSVDEGLVSPRVSLTLSDQSVVEVDGPKIFGSKVVGFVHGVYQEYPAASVKQAQVRVLSGARTAAVVAASVGAFGGLVYLLLGKGDPGADPCDGPDADPDLCG